MTKAVLVLDGKDIVIQYNNVRIEDVASVVALNKARYLYKGYKVVIR